jgi:hypothetical protein
MHKYYSQYIYWCRILRNQSFCWQGQDSKIIACPKSSMICACFSTEQKASSSSSVASCLQTSVDGAQRNLQRVIFPFPYKGDSTLQLFLNDFEKNGLVRISRISFWTTFECRNQFPCFVDGTHENPVYLSIYVEYTRTRQRKIFRFVRHALQSDFRVIIKYRILSYDSATNFSLDSG